MTDNVIVTKPLNALPLSWSVRAAHDLQPAEAMLLPGLFRKAAKVVDQAVLRFTKTLLKMKSWVFLAAQARKLGATDEAKKLWEEHLQEASMSAQSKQRITTEALHLPEVQHRHRIRWDAQGSVWRGVGQRRSGDVR